MIIEGYNQERFSDAPNENRGQMMKIPGSRKHETPKTAPELFMKCFDRTSRRNEPKRSPDVRRVDLVQRLHPKRQLKIPGVVKSEPSRISGFPSAPRYHSSPAFANF
jgi:hypothetical protein